MIAIWFSALLAHAATVRASSTLKNSEGTFLPQLAFDGQLKTGWAEGATGSGEGQWLELDLGAPTLIQSISVWPGNLENGNTAYKEYGRPKVIQVLVDDKPYGGLITVEDEVQRLDVPVGAKGRKVKIVIDRAYEGIVHEDLYIAEVALDFVEGGGVGKLATWLEGPSAKSAREKYVVEVEQAYAAHKDQEFGNAEAFAFLAEAAAEGAPYVRKTAQTMVPLGYRVQAIPSDDTAREALRKLKDSNAIPALSLAALRSTGARQDEIQESVEIFEAYQAMLGGGSRNVPAWGASGYESGAFQAFGEPLAIEVDRWGDFLVADTGNNRIQLITDEGRFKRSWGKPPTSQELPAELTNAWFGAGRSWYASGSAPSEDAGAFVNPVDVTIIPQKKVDWWAAIDAKNRIQVFDDTGKQLIGWTVRSENSPDGGLGGQSHLVWIDAKDLLVAVIQDEAIAYSLEAQEVARFQITDGIPSAVEVSKNGLLLFGYPEAVVQYNPDGFRYGQVLGPDQLGRGFEAFDLTLDDKKKLWIFTDTGRVIKLKNPSKVDFQVQGLSHTVRNPRIAVRDGFVYYTGEDRIGRIDAEQVKMDEEEAAKEKEEEAAEGEAPVAAEHD